jgi:ABC-type glycerol-3-phosphate transport system permease component
MVTHQQRLAARQTRRGLRTGIAIVLLALMLFPVYWMLNISLQPSGGTLPSSFFPPTRAWPATTPLYRIRARISSPAC